MISILLMLPVAGITHTALMYFHDKKDCLRH